MATFRVNCNKYTISGTIGSVPTMYTELIKHSRLHEDFGIKSADGTALVVTVESQFAKWPELIVSQRFYPGPEAGFHPGVLIAPETHLLVLGAGERLLAYDIRVFRRLWEDVADTGFWNWKRHDDVIVMSAELELAAWDIEGNKLWSMFVEPPWEYSVQSSKLHLDVMGKKSNFDIKIGPKSDSIGQAN